LFNSFLGEVLRASGPRYEGTMPPTRPPRLSRNWLLVPVSVLAALVFLEVAVRLARGFPLLSMENRIARRIALLAVHRVNSHDPLLGWVYREHHADGVFTTGELGLRMNGPVDRPLSTGAVLACGDSFTVGEEVSDQFTWPARLEALLGKPVLNAGVGGFGADQIVLRAESLIPRLAPRTLIVSFLVDESLGDLGRAVLSTFAGANKPYFLVSEGQLVLRNNPVPLFSGRPGELGVLRSVLGRSALADWTAETVGATSWWHFGRGNTPTGADPAQVADLLLRRLKERTDREGIELVLLLQYSGGEVIRRDREPEIVRQLQTTTASAGIATVDTWDAWKQHLAEQGETGFRELYVMHEGERVFGHLSQKGNELTARLLAGHLKQEPVAAH